MAAILEARASEADICSLLTGCAVRFPAEDCERSCADFAFGIMVAFEHLDVVVLWEAVLADGGKVCSLPARAVQILLDLRRHGEDTA